MLRTLEDYYRDAVESGALSAARFWLEVASDEARSLAREHLAALSDTISAWSEQVVMMKTAFPVGGAIAATLLLLGLRVWLYPAVLNAPHGGGSAVSSIAGVTLLTLAYAVVALVILRVLRARPQAYATTRQAALWRATWLGALAGVCALGAIAVDTYMTIESLSLGVWTLVCLAAALAWGLAGVTAASASGSWRLGSVAALWSGMVSALLAAVGEVVMTLVALPRLTQLELSNPDYLYWRQPDVQSYAIASSLALAMIGLALAPLVASVIGGLGGWLSASGSRVSPPPRPAA